MHVPSEEFDNEYTIGETKAVLAPLLHTTAEAIHSYIVITFSGGTNEAVITLISNDGHPECRIRLLAKAIELTAGDMPHA